MLVIRCPGDHPSVGSSSLCLFLSVPLSSDPVVGGVVMTVLVERLRKFGI